MFLFTIDGDIYFHAIVIFALQAVILHQYLKSISNTAKKDKN